MLTAYDTEAAAQRAASEAYGLLRSTVYPMIKAKAALEGATHHYARWLRTWWHPREPSRRFFGALDRLSRFIACSNPQARPIFSFLSPQFVPTNTMQVFAFEDDYSFGIIQSSQHWSWTTGGGGNVRQDTRYTTHVWKTFPWPQDPTDTQVAAVAAAGRGVRRTRETLMIENGWTLRALYQAAEVDGPHPLKDAQAALDAAVGAAYGVPANLDVIEFLLELNLLVAEDEDAGRKVRGPGLPDELDPNDPRWMSTDRIEPPAAE
ncbi:MAG: hypothetical protein IPL61_09590 [Myxococcales bacterium]|nr:hypothetical protein [Myxococcales bacterium]